MINEKPKPEKLNKVALLKSFKDDMQSADSLRIETVTKVEAWKNAYNGELYGNEQTGKSKLVSRDIKRQDEWQHASIKDPFLSSSDIVKCNPITFEDKAAAEQNELILNYQFTRKFNRYKFITDSIKLMSTEGTLVVKTCWDYEDEEVENEYPVYELDDITGEPYQSGTKMVTEINVIENKPNAEACRIEDIYIDPTCMGDMDKCQFIIHRYESDMSTLRTCQKYKKELLDEVAKDLRKDTADYTEEDETNFTFKDDPRKKILVHEYWGNYDIEGTGIAKPIVCVWVNKVMIKLESNPYPDKKIPFLIVANNSIPFQITGEANAEVIGDNQKVTTAIKRGLIDNMANSNNGQKGIRKGALDTLNRKRFLSGKNFEFNNNPNDFYEGAYNSLPNSVFQMLELVNSETESITGVKGFAGGINGAGLGNTARAAGGVLDAVSVRKLDIVRNVAENLIKPLMRKWMSYNSEFLKEEEVVRITNEEFVPIKRDDLKGNIDIEIEVSTAEDNAAKGEKLSFLLQTLGQNLPSDQLNMLMAEVAKLNKMPDLAKSLKEYKPQPDPFAEQMKMLEMEKLKSEIAERNSRAQENKIDMRLKSAKADLAEAQARAANSGTDVKDAEFIRNATGANFDEKMMEKDHDRETQKELEFMKGLQKN